MALITNLVSYWKLDETSGSRADAHGSNTLADNNTVLYGTGIISNGADFEDTNTEYLSIADASQSGLDITGSYSVSFWLKYESIPPAQDSAVGFYTKYVKSTAGYEAYLEHYPTNTYKINLLYSGGTFNQRIWNITTPTTGVWYHYVFVVVPSATGSDCKLYINGVSAGAPTSSSGTQTSIANGAGSFDIGNVSRFGGDATLTTFDGLIDEFGIWSRVLDSTEVTSLYNGGAGLAYPFPSTFVARVMII